MLGLLELGLGDRARDDPGTRVDVRLAVLEDRASDRDGRVQVAVVAKVTDRAAIQAPSLVLGCLIAVYVAAKIYRVGLLMYGKRPTVGELARWVTVS